MAPLPPLTILDPYAWERSTVTRLALGELVSAGQLAANEEGRPAEWIVPPAGDHAPNPPEGYVVSFIRFHERGFAAPASRFMRALCHRYGVELHNFAPNAILQAATFVGICEGYLGIPVNWELWIHLFRAELFTHDDGAQDPPRGARRQHVARPADVVQGRLHPLDLDDEQRRLGAGVVLPAQRRARPPPLHWSGAPGEAQLLGPWGVHGPASEAAGLAPGRPEELLVEVGPKGGCRHNSPLCSLPPFGCFSRASASTCARRGNARLNRTVKETRKYSTDRRPLDLRKPSVLSSHYSVSVSLQGVHYL
jgi:hypothetical protein